MKKKKIERIKPFDSVFPKSKPYFAIPAIADVDGIETLLVDIYERTEETYEFIMRAAYTAHDWGLWNPQTGVWSGRSIEDPAYDTPTYDKYDMLSGPGLPKKADWKNTAMSETGIETVIGFYKSMKPSYERYIFKGQWWRALTGIECEIKSEREQKKLMSREKSLQERSADVPEIPEDFEEWADQEIFGRKEYIYYKRKGRYADCQCSKCGAEYRILNKRREGIEGLIEHVEPTPVNGESTTCLKCGADATYKPRGRMKYRYAEFKYAYLLQPYRRTGTVIRFFQVYKEWLIDGVSCIEKKEIGRTYIDTFRKTKCDWHFIDGWTGQSGWYDHNVGGMRNISYCKGFVYDRNWNEWTDRVRYSGLREFMELDGSEQKPTYFLNASRRFEVEKMIKCGLVNLTKKLVSGEEWYFHPGRHRRIEDTLGIRRCRLRMIQEYDDAGLLRALQLERENTYSIMHGWSRGKGEWTEEQIMKAWAMRLTAKDYKDMLKYMTITQMINRVERYIGRKIKSDAPEIADERAKQTALLYRDYIRLRDETNMDLTRSTSIYPKDLQEAHRKAVNTANAAKNEERLKRLEDSYPDVKRRYRKLKAKYGYKEGEYFIRPAKNIREILEEGQILHHCVAATDTYISKHDRGESAILFLRRVMEPNEPFITVEIAGKEVRQWYGRNDTKPDEKVMQEWIDKWVGEITKEPAQAIENAECGMLTAAG